jgi:hypothetical protein
MSIEQWEHCVLAIEGSKKHSKGLLGGGSEGWSYDCSIWYYGPAGDVTKVTLASISDVISYNPFDKAMALLGGAGWEIVSVQHGTALYTTGMGSYMGGKLHWDNIIAYFKRPVIAGRTVDQPKLNLP